MSDTSALAGSVRTPSPARTQRHRGPGLRCPRRERPLKAQRSARIADPHAQPSARRALERVTGIEPASPAWKAGALPLSYTRISSLMNSRCALATAKPTNSNGTRSTAAREPIAVGKAGLEPATPCSQSRCATNLRHFPGDKPSVGQPTWPGCPRPARPLDVASGPRRTQRQRRRGSPRWRSPGPGSHAR
jgi:hypothetical protein